MLGESGTGEFHLSEHVNANDVKKMKDEGEERRSTTLLVAPGWMRTSSSRLGSQEGPSWVSKPPGSNNEDGPSSVFDDMNRDSTTTPERRHDDERGLHLQQHRQRDHHGPDREPGDDKVEQSQVNG
jgi:hypothetical protein